MSRSQKRKHRRKKKIKKLLLLLSVFIGVFFYSLIVYGENAFYAIKTFIYEDKALDINIEAERNDDLENINLNFINEGRCDVYLRGFVFVYPKIDGNNGTILSNSSVVINYGEDDYWFYGEDNYIYYTKPLNAGNRTEKPMVKSIDINLSEEDKRMLGNGQLGADIVMEAVQVDNFAYKYEWDMDNLNLENYFNNNISEGQEGKEVIRINIK